MLDVASLITVNNGEMLLRVSHQLIVFPKSSYWIIADLSHLSYKHLWVFSLRLID